MALLLLPKRLGVGVEVVLELVELAEGLVEVIKENAGFDAAAESAALCPKLNTGFGGSVDVVSLLSAGLPKVNVG